MSGIKNTQGNVVDYSILAGKSKSSSNKQNGGQKEDLKPEMSIEEKYVSPIAKKVKNKGEIATWSSQNTERNVFNKFMASIDDTELQQNKMVAMEHEFEDNEVVLNKQIRKQIIGRVRDNRTGSIMPVELEQKLMEQNLKRWEKELAICLAWRAMVEKELAICLAWRAMVEMFLPLLQIRNITLILILQEKQRRADNKDSKSRKHVTLTSKL